MIYLIKCLFIFINNSRIFSSVVLKSGWSLLYFRSLLLLISCCCNACISINYFRQWFVGLTFWLLVLCLFLYKNLLLLWVLSILNQFVSLICSYLWVASFVVVQGRWRSATLSNSSSNFVTAGMSVLWFVYSLKLSHTFKVS